MKVLMIGPGKHLKGGISSVVESYYNIGLDSMVDLTYLETVNEGDFYKKVKFALESLRKFKIMSIQNDVIHIHMSSRGSFYRKSLFILKAYKLNKNIIVHVHGSEFEIFYNKESNMIAKKYIRYIFSLCSKVIALSEEWKEILTQITDRKKIEVLYNSIEVKKCIKSKNYEKKKVLFLGKIGVRKGVYDILEVAPNIIKKHPNVEFIIAGDGEIDNVRKICEMKKINRNFNIFGWTSGSDKISLLNEATIYLLPSYNEGMPISILEAMSHGLPIISTNVGGIPQLITNGKEGFLFNAGDLRALEKNLEKLLESQTLRKELGSNSFNKVNNNFNLNSKIKKLYDIYESTIR